MKKNYILQNPMGLSFIVCIILLSSRDCIIDFTVKSFSLEFSMIAIGLLTSFASLKLRIRNYIPSTWTGLGILFTFISFVLGLATLDLKNSNPAQDLMTILPTAFTTSIYGMAMSIYWGFFNRVIDQEQEESLQKKIKYTPEEILLRMCNETQHMTMLLSTLNENIVSIKKSNISIKEQAQDTHTLVNTNFDFLLKKQDNLILKFNTSELNSSFKNLSEIMEKSIASLNKNLEKSIGKMTNVIDNEMEKLASSLPNVVNDLSTSIEQLNEDTSHQLSESLFALNSQLQNVSKQLLTQSQDNLAKESAKNMSAYIDMQDNMMTEVKEVMRNGVRGIGEVMNELNAMTKELQDSLLQIKEWNGTNAEAFESATSQYRKAVIDFNEKIMPLYQERVETIKDEINFMDDFRKDYSRELEQRGEREIELKKLILSISDISDYINTAKASKHLKRPILETESN